MNSKQAYQLKKKGKLNSVGALNTHPQTQDGKWRQSQEKPCPSYSRAGRHWGRVRRCPPLQQGAKRCPSHRASTKTWEDRDTKRKMFYPQIKTAQLMGSECMHIYGIKNFNSLFSSRKKSQVFVNEFHINRYFICLKPKHCQFEKKSTVII